jgi:SPX domain protein involved in polyphosphate accumulation
MSEFIKRKETKYLIDEKSFAPFLAEIESHLERDKHFHQRIHNVYFDNPTNDIVRLSLTKPDFKEKLRLRAYESLDTAKGIYEIAFIELKIKYNGIVYKKRATAKINRVNDVISGKGGLDALLENADCRADILNFAERKNCKPKIYLSYDRMSYRELGNDDLRITFDTNLKYRTGKLALASDRADLLYFDAPTQIMEIKTGAGYPAWLTSALTKYKIFPHSFSKYGKIYEKETRKTKGAN